MKRKRKYWNKKDTLKILKKGTSSTKTTTRIFCQREYFRQKQPKKYKKVIYEEESDNGLEVEESQYVPEEKEQIEEPKKEKNKLHEKEEIIFLTN